MSLARSAASLFGEGPLILEGAWDYTFLRLEKRLGSSVGKKWIWFRGLVRWKVHWGDFEQAFRRARPNDEIQMLDFPGFGDFYQLQSPQNLDALLDHVDEHVRGEGPFCLLAFSLGGMVAAHWAARHPQHVEKTFLINTSDRRSPFYQRFQVQNWGSLIKGILEPTAENVETLILKIISNDLQLQQRYQLTFIENFKQTPFSRRSLYQQMTLASKIRFPDRAPAPTVFLASKQDRLVNFQCSQRLAEAWKTSLELHETAGHDLTLDDPDWVLKKLQKHLEVHQDLRAKMD